MRNADPSQTWPPLLKQEKHFDNFIRKKTMCNRFLKINFNWSLYNENHPVLEKCIIMDEGLKKVEKLWNSYFLIKCLINNTERMLAKRILLTLFPWTTAYAFSCIGLSGRCQPSEWIQICSGLVFLCNQANSLNSKVNKWEKENKYDDWWNRVYFYYMIACWILGKQVEYIIAVSDITKSKYQYCIFYIINEICFFLRCTVFTVNNFST